MQVFFKKVLSVFFCSLIGTDAMGELFFNAGV